jgi:hypothetical protein
MSDPTQAQRERTVTNERLKFVAQALDRSATGCVVVGLFAPLTVGGLTAQVGFAWIAAAVALHLIGLWLLGKLR